MKPASYHVAGTVSSWSIFRSQKTIRRNFFDAILAALQSSRRAQAQRVLRRYRHLIADSKDTDLHNLNTTIGDDKECR
jgi:hypothetical protein